VAEGSVAGSEAVGALPRLQRGQRGRGSRRGRDRRAEELVRRKRPLAEELATEHKDYRGSVRRTTHGGEACDDEDRRGRPTRALGWPFENAIEIILPNKTSAQSPDRLGRCRSQGRLFVLADGRLDSETY
jgi:hypothetical protein